MPNVTLDAQQRQKVNLILSGAMGQMMDGQLGGKLIKRRDRGRMNRWAIEWQVQLMNVGEAGWKDDTKETKNMEGR